MAKTKVKTRGLTDLNVTNAKIAAGTIDVTAKITGVVPSANLGSGTASSSTYLAGDSTYKTITTGTSWQSVETGATFTAVAGNGYPVNTTAQACTVTLPAGSVGDTIEFVDYAGTWDTNRVFLTANGSEKIKGSTDDVSLDIERQGIKIVYVDATQGWEAITGVNETAPALNPPEYDIDFLVVAGGGSGGGEAGGGGGGGGFRTATETSVASGIEITVTVGDGGSAASSSGDGNQGSSSSFSATGMTTITSAGGGAGAFYTNDGGDGGCGGGGGGKHSSDPGGGDTAGGASAPVTDPVQGYAGGAGDYPPSARCAGGGGGSGEVGEDYQTDPKPGDGGDGATSDILVASSDVNYAGGGGGGTNSSGTTGSTGGAGGGGAGGTNASPSPTVGAVNTGGGSGGIGLSSGTGAAGGKGVVILRFPSANWSGTVTGSPTESTDGDYKVLKFTGDGTYTTQ